MPETYGAVSSLGLIFLEQHVFIHSSRNYSLGKSEISCFVLNAGMNAVNEIAAQGVGQKLINRPHKKICDCKCQECRWWPSGSERTYQHENGHQESGPWTVKDKGNHNLVKDINFFYFQLQNWTAYHSMALVSILMAQRKWLIIQTQENKENK